MFHSSLVFPKAPVHPLSAWLAEKLGVALPKVNLAVVRQFLKEDITDKDIDSMAGKAMLRLIDVTLSMYDVLYVPPGWMILERAHTLTVAGLVTSCAAKPSMPLADAPACASLRHLIQLMPAKPSAQLASLSQILTHLLREIENVRSEASGAGAAPAAGS